MYRYHGVSVFEDIGNILGIDESHMKALLLNQVTVKFKGSGNVHYLKLLRALHYPS